MNYSELNDAYTTNYYNYYNYNNYSSYNSSYNLINSNNPELILNEYNILLQSLDNYKKEYENIIKNNEFFLNYLNNSHETHLYIMNIINYSIDSNINFNNYSNINFNNDSNINFDVSKLYMNYNEKITDSYNNWLKNYYIPNILKIENNIAIIEKKINDFRNLFIYIINKILKTTEINNDNKKICPICFENEVNICLNPCGHTICSNCISKNRNLLVNLKCYSCRSEIRDYIKIYFSV